MTDTSVSYNKLEKKVSEKQLNVGGKKITKSVKQSDLNNEIDCIKKISHEQMVRLFDKE